MADKKILTNMELDMVADMEVDKVAENLADMVADKKKRWPTSSYTWCPLQNVIL